MKTLLACLALVLAAVPLYADSNALPGGPFPAQVNAVAGKYTTKAVPVSVNSDGSVNVAATAAAGELHLGEVGGKAAIATGTFTRPADTTAYASGDLVANNTTAGSVTPITLTVGRGASGSAASGMIRRVRLITSSTNITNAAFRIHFYKTTSPTVTNGDNGAWLSNQSANYIGSIDVTVDKAFSDGAGGIGIPSLGSEINFTTQTIYALIEARAAYTPTSAGTFTINLECLQN